MYVYMSARMSPCMYVYVCRYVCMYTRVYLYTYICMYLYMWYSTDFFSVLMRMNKFLIT